MLLLSAPSARFLFVVFRPLYFIRGATASEALHFIHQKSCGEVRPDLWFSDPALARVLVNQAGPPSPYGKGGKEGAENTPTPSREQSFLRKGVYYTQGVKESEART